MNRTKQNANDELTKVRRRHRPNSEFFNWQFFVVAFILSIPGTNSVVAQATEDPAIKEMLETFLKDEKYPGAVAAIAERGKPIRIAAAGVRKHGTNKPVKFDDMMHLGSCTKAMTSTLAARLVGKGKIQWDSTVESVWPNESKKFHEDCRSITLRQLLRHRAGIKPNLSNEEWRKTSGSDQEIRENVAFSTLAQKPQSTPGTEHEYSNLGYMIAGSMLEKVEGKNWQSLMQDEIFKPLGITTGDFGVVGKIGKITQPWGHAIDEDGEIFPLQIDNPSPLGPAGTVKMSVADWAKFVLEHGADHDTDFLTDELHKELQTPGPTHNYAMGWVKFQRGWAGGDALMHNGSNTSFYSLVWFAPKQNRAYLVVMNCFGGDTRIAADQIVGKLLDLTK